MFQISRFQRKKKQSTTAGNMHNPQVGTKSLRVPAPEPQAMLRERADSISFCMDQSRFSVHPGPSGQTLQKTRGLGGFHNDIISKKRAGCSFPGALASSETAWTAGQQQMVPLDFHETHCTQTHRKMMKDPITRNGRNVPHSMTLVSKVISTLQHREGPVIEGPQTTTTHFSYARKTSCVVDFSCFRRKHSRPNPGLGGYPPMLRHNEKR